MNNNILNLVTYINDNKLGHCATDYTFKKLTTLKVGGKIALTYFPNSYLSFLDFYFYVIENYSLDIFVIGNGSNILASDDDYNGIVVCFKEVEDELNVVLKDSNGLVTVTGGCTTKRLSIFLLEHSLSGAEAIASIPATIGGIIAMNATCFGYITQNYIKKCLVLDKDKIYWIYNDEMEFSYRNSIFLKKKLIILKAVFEFPVGNKEEIKENIKKIIEKRKNTQPVNLKSGGSTFKNGNDYYAWKIIDEVGLRGYEINGAKVSDLHSNFIVNTGKATSKDIYDLMKHIIRVVKEIKNITLESEWVLINFKN